MRIRSVSFAPAKIAGLFIVALVVLGLTACSSSAPKAKPLPVTIDGNGTQINSQWRKSTGSGTDGRQLFLAPADLGDSIVTVDANGRLTKVSSNDGVVIWKEELKRTIIGGVGVGSGMVLVNDNVGNVLALSAATGKKLWEANVRSQVSSQPFAASGVVAVHTDDGHLVALDADTGKERWTLKMTLPALTLHGSSNPIIVGDVVLVGQPNGRVAIVALGSGELLAEHIVARPHGSSELDRLVDIQGDLLLEPNTIYGVTYQGKAAALEPQSGRTIWYKDISSYRSMAKDERALYISAADGSVWALNKANGTTIWLQKAFLNRVLSAPAVYQGYVIVGDEEGNIYALDALTGKVRAKLNIGSTPISVQPIVNGDNIYVYDNGGTLDALTLVNKE